MRIIGFLNEFDCVATTGDYNRLLCKILPDFDPLDRCRVGGEICILLSYYLQETDRKIVRISEIDPYLDSIGYGAKRVVLEILKSFSFLEFPRWQSNPRKVDGTFVKSFDESILLS